MRRDPDTGEPNGILEEAALMDRVSTLFMQEPLSWPLEQRVRMIEDAVRHYNEAGHFSFDEENMGTIEPGRYADFVVLDRDITAISAERITNARVWMTVVGGEVVYKGT